MDLDSIEKELLETFEAAKKAADAAAAGGGSSEEDRCVDALKQLRKMPVTMKDLVTTQVGKGLRHLTKNPREKIQAVASELFDFWKSLVIEETSKNNRKTGISEVKGSVKVEVKSERPETVKIEKIQKAGAGRIDRGSRSESLEAEKIYGDEGIKAKKVVNSETVKVEETGESWTDGVEKLSAAETIKVEKQSPSTKKPSSYPIGPPKLSSMVKCNDPLRDKLRELLAEAFSRVLGETSDDDREEVRNISDEVNACDPIRVAVSVESAMYEKLGRSNGAQKFKYRSIMFNLKDSHNTDLRRKVLLGHVMPEKLINMTPEEMASDKRKHENKQIKEKALFECERAGAPKATTDQFKCGRCGQRKTTYHQMQTRSADEPMTTFVTCVNCNNHWKFC